MLKKCCVVRKGHTENSYSKLDENLLPVQSITSKRKSLFLSETLNLFREEIRASRNSGIHYRLLKKTHPGDQGKDQTVIHPTSMRPCPILGQN